MCRCAYVRHVLEGRNDHRRRPQPALLNQGVAAPITARIRRPQNGALHHAGRNPEINGMAEAFVKPQSASVVGVNSKSATGTLSKNALCSLCEKGHRTGFG